MGISDYLVKIEELTNTNLKLLKALNSAFYTDKNHLSVNMGDEGTFTIPSFITLENKINALQDNFQNLVNSPVTSDAYFVFDGNSRAIQVKGYEYGPSPLVLPTQSEFYHENNNVFKDFLNPTPYLKFDIESIPNDINTVIVRKVAAVSNELKERFSTLLGESASVSVSWGDINKMLSVLVEGVDYVIYDTTKKLPVRTGQGTGSYVIKEISKEEIDENLDQHLTVSIANDIPGFQSTLTYLLFDQTIERNLSIGDYLVSWDGTSKFEIEDLNINTNTIKLKVLYGEYSGLIPYEGTGSILDECKLKFFSNSDIFQGEKYVKVPLEEDEYIYVCISPLNDKMNIRAPWGTGILVHVDSLIKEDAAEGEDPTFRAYYNNCTNIGDILNEISKVMSNTTSSHTNEELNDYMSAKPELDTDIIQVVHINKHLDETFTIKNIRELYSQKNNYNVDLTETQGSITELQNELANVDFTDTDGRRTTIQNQINELTRHKNDLINSLIKITNEIALTANNSIVPIENAKYRIRGFFDFEDFVNKLSDEYHNITSDNIKGIYVQYRYRSIEQETGTAQSFVKDNDGDGVADKTFIFSDWNELRCPLRPRIRKSDGTYGPYQDTSNMNLPSFNQLDIPISQGERVDVRLMVIYDFGYPFIQMTSSWSDVVTFDFPDKFIKDVQVIDIIKENNDDIETNRFKSLLTDYGMVSHVDDKLIDQDKTYYHKPENIASGFYTAERRVIPLKDKLQSIDNDMIALKDEIYGTASDQLAVNIDFDESTISLSPFEKGKVILKEYSYFEDQASGWYGNYNLTERKVVCLSCNIRLTNTSNHSLKLYSMFPGTENTPVKDLQYSTWGTENIEKYKNIWVRYPDDDSSSSTEPNFKLQTTNQIITFINCNKYDGTPYYSNPNGSDIPAGDDFYPFYKNNILWGKINSNDSSHTDLDYYQERESQQGTFYGMSVYPYVHKSGGLVMTYKEAYSYMLLNPGDEIIIPVMVEYHLANESGEKIVDKIEKTISFDIRTSLYKDPMNFTVTFIADYDANTQNKFVSELIKKYTPSITKTKEYNTIIE